MCAKNVKGTVHVILYYVYILPLLFTGLLIFYVSQFYAYMYIHVCVCVLHVLMYLILINASFCFVHAVQESQTVQRLR